jgi:biopolymer transport protein ExbD
VPYGDLMDVLELLRTGGYTKVKLVALEAIPNADGSAPAAPKP